MGYNFGTIVIKKNASLKDDEIRIVRNQLAKRLNKIEGEFSHQEYLAEKWKRSEALLALYSDDKIILIEDEYYRFEDNVLQWWSKKFVTEVIRVFESSTADMGFVTLYDKGELKRKFSYGVVTPPDHEGEPYQDDDLGEKTIYEVAGDLLGTLHNFMNNGIEVFDLEPLEVYAINNQKKE